MLQARLSSLGLENFLLLNKLVMGEFCHPEQFLFLSVEKILSMSLMELGASGTQFA